MSIKRIHLDWETFSEIDIRDVGAYRYANDPTTCILVAGMAFEDEEPVVWDCTMSDCEDWELEEFQPYWDALEDPSVLIYAHNAQFEMAICQALLWKTWGIRCPDLRRFRCTMSLARRAALPAKLETLSEALNLAQPKDKRGKALIKKFSMMQPARRASKKHPQGLPPHRIRPEDDPVAFAEFCEYCRQDVRAEQEVTRRLAYFDEPINNANYSLDAIINARGVTVNLKALRHAQKLIEEETAIVSEKFRGITGVEITQRDAFLQWLHTRGCHLDDLQADTIEEFLGKFEHVETGTDDPIDALRLKSSAAYASIKKISTMLNCVGPADNRLRGMIEYHVATTGRWGGRLVQMQNFKRATIEHSQAAYQEICEGISREMLELCYGPVLEVISSCIRHFIQDCHE